MSLRGAIATKQSPNGEVRAKALPQYVEAPAGLSRLLADFQELSRGFIPANHEDDVLYPLATEQVSIDLDDGVKVNYGKFGEALSPIKGL